MAVLIVAIDYRHFERLGWFAYGTGVVLLILVFLLAPEIRGSQRWLRIGAFSLQPSELMKIFLIIALAKYLHNDPKTEGRTLKDLVIPGLILGVPMLLILMQPDLGTALMCAFIFASIMVLTNLKLRSLFTLVSTFARERAADLGVRPEGLPARTVHLLLGHALRREPRHPRRRLARVPVAGRHRQRRRLRARGSCRARRTSTASCPTSTPTSRSRCGPRSTA